MIRILIPLVALAVPALAATVADCTDGTLASYIALGSDGCQLGVYRVFDFQEISPSFGADPIASSAVSIMSATGANFGSLSIFSVGPEHDNGARARRFSIRSPVRSFSAA